MLIDMKEYNRTMTEPFGKDNVKGNNLILSKHVRLAASAVMEKKTEVNANTCIIGTSGRGDFESLLPNLMEAKGSFVIMDIMGDCYAHCADFLEKQGYRIRCLNLDRPEEGDSYNPFAYIRDEDDIVALTSAIMGTKTGREPKMDAFWDKCEAALINAVISFVKEMLILKMSQVSYLLRQDIRELDKIFDRAGKEDGFEFAVRQYKIFKTALPDTQNSIRLSAGVKLQIFDLEEIQSTTKWDNMHLGTLDEDKTALFVILSGHDCTFKMLGNMLISQVYRLIQPIEDESDASYAVEEGVDYTPLPIRIYLRDMENMGYIPNLADYLNTVQAYGMTTDIRVNSVARLQELYPDQWEAILNNCGSVIFMAGQADETTSEWFSRKTGEIKQSIDFTQEKKTRKKKEPVEITPLSLEQIRTMKEEYCLIIQGLDRAFLDEKYRASDHPNWKYCDGAHRANPKDRKNIAQECPVCGIPEELKEVVSMVEDGKGMDVRVKKKAFVKRHKSVICLTAAGLLAGAGTYLLARSIRKKRG